MRTPEGRAGSGHAQCRALTKHPSPPTRMDVSRMMWMGVYTSLALQQNCGPQRLNISCVHILVDSGLDCPGADTLRLGEN